MGVGGEQFFKRFPPDIAVRRHDVSTVTAFAELGGLSLFIPDFGKFHIGARQHGKNIFRRLADFGHLGEQGFFRWRENMLFLAKEVFKIEIIRGQFGFTLPEFGQIPGRHGQNVRFNEGGGGADFRQQAFRPAGQRLVMAVGGVFIPPHPGIGEDFGAGDAQLIPQAQTFQQQRSGLVQLSLIRGNPGRQRFEPVKIGLPGVVGGIDIFKFPAGLRRDFVAGGQLGGRGRFGAGAGKQHGADQQGDKRGMILSHDGYTPFPFFSKQVAMIGVDGSSALIGPVSFADKPAVCNNDNTVGAKRPWPY